MAFHPFATFRKNQKFWMASLILLCMLTFVLCTGVGGDFGSRLIEYFSHGLRGGPTVARLFNRNVTIQELEQLREQRNIANDYMRQASRKVLEHVDTLKKDILKVKEADRAIRMQLLTAIEMDLKERLKKPRYFETGNKVEDLLDFMIWRKEAERLGIQLTRQFVTLEINRAVHYILHHGDESNTVVLYSSDDSRIVEDIVRHEHYRATSDSVHQALREEFEVRIAKLVLSAVRPSSLYSVGMKGYSFYTPLEWRQGLSPEQFWDYFKQNRAETDYALLPLPVEEFIAKVKEDPKQRPTEIELTDLFNKYKNKVASPTSITPGFKAAEMVKIEWVAADPDSPKYRAAAATLLAMQTTPPVFSPIYPELSALIRLGAGQPALDTSLHRNYRALIKQGYYPSTRMTDAGFPLHWYPRFNEPEGVASMLAALVPGSDAGAFPLTNALGGVFGNQAAAVAVDQKKLAPAVAAESRKRVPWFATMFLSTTTPNTLMSIGGVTDAWAAPIIAQGRKAYLVEQHLPFAAVRDALMRQMLYSTARDLVQTSMDVVLRDLRKPETINNANYIKIRLQELVPRFGLTHKATQEFRNRYDIASDPNLKEFKAQFEDGKFIAEINLYQGRGGTEKMLHPDDFWKLFFDPSETTLSARNDGTYFPRPWPPVEIEVKDPYNPAAKETRIKLWAKAPMPILFWKTASEPAKTPPNLAAVRKEVEHAWYYLKAREYLLTHEAKDIAEAVQKSVDKLKEDTLDAESVKVRQEMLKLRGVAPLSPDTLDSSMPVKYGPYQLPKGAVPHARADMVKELLALRDLKSPIEIPTNKDDPNQKLIESVNKLNKDLLARKVPGQQVQILTNEPMSVFYVTLVTRAHEPSFEEFYRAYERAVSPTNRDRLLAQTQEQMGQQFERQLIEQLRAAHGFEITDPEEQKKFDDLER